MSFTRAKAQYKVVFTYGVRDDLLRLRAFLI
jgi:hypothetical protein